MTYMATLESYSEPAPGQIDANVRFSNGQRVVVRTYTLKGTQANRHSLREVVAGELAAMDLAEAEATKFRERVGGDISSFACSCGMAGCPQTGNHWLRPPG